LTDSQLITEYFSSCGPSQVNQGGCKTASTLVYAKKPHMP